MENLVQHLVRPMVSHPDDISIQTVEGDATVMLEMVVHPDDHARVVGSEGRTLRAIRTVLSAGAGKRKATLDLVEEHAASDEE